MKHTMKRVLALMLALLMAIPSFAFADDDFSATNGVSMEESMPTVLGDDFVLSDYDLEGDTSGDEDGPGEVGLLDGDTEPVDEVPQQDVRVRDLVFPGIPARQQTERHRRVLHNQKMRGPLALSRRQGFRPRGRSEDRIRRRAQEWLRQPPRRNPGKRNS